MNWNAYVSKQDSIALTDLSSTDTLEWTAADTTLLLERGWFLDAANSMGKWSVEGDYAYGIILGGPDTSATNIGFTTPMTGYEKGDVETYFLPSSGAEESSGGIDPGVAASGHDVGATGGGKG